MPVKDNYEKRSFDELEAEALAYIAKAPLARCGSIGDELFADHCGRLNGSAPYARIAGRVVKRLEAKGLVKYDPDNLGGWVLTEKGKRQVEVKS